MDVESFSDKLVTKLTEAHKFVRESLQHSSEKQHDLREKVKELKCQVQDDITSHLELLRNREVWLLDHIDLLFQLKEEALVNQRQDLTSHLAKLEVYLEILQDGLVEKCNDQVVQEINKLVTNIKRISLESDCEIAYSGNNQSLGKAIKNFGHFSEDSHNKITEIQTKHATLSSSHVDVIRKHFDSIITSPNEQWLAPREEDIKREVQTEVSANLTRETQQTNYSEWLFRKTEVTKNTETSSSFIVDHFREIMSQPDSEWLIHSSTTQPGAETMPCSRVPPSDGWLLAKDGGHCESDVEVVSTQDDMCGDWVVTSQEVVSQIKEDSNSSWLLKRPSEDRLEDDQWLKQFRDSLDLRNSGWLSTSSDDYCQWLTPGADHCKDCPRNESCPKETLKVFKNVWASSRDEWLNTTKDW